MRWAIAIAGAVGLLAAGYLYNRNKARTEAQLQALEGRFAYELRDAVETRIRGGGSPPTNWTDLFGDLTALEPWSAFEEGFLKYGRRAGFTNSLLEKYVFIVPPIRAPIPSANGQPVEAELLMMNAQPFRSRGVSRRIVIFQSGKEVHDWRFAETWVQEVFTKGGPHVSSAGKDAASHTGVATTGTETGPCDDLPSVSPRRNRPHRGLGQGLLAMASDRDRPGGDHWVERHRFAPGEAAAP